MYLCSLANLVSMYEKTQAIVLSAFKYKDNSLIVRCFTEEFAAQSYLLKGVLSSGKGKLRPALFQPLTLLEVVATHKHHEGLEYIKEARLLTVYQSLHTDIYKSAVTLFLAEVISGVCVSDQRDIELFSFIKERLLYFDRMPFSANFHLKFLLEMTRYLGFYPDTTEADLPYFNLEEGHFDSIDDRKYTISGDVLVLFTSLLAADDRDLPAIKATKVLRNRLLELLLKYYQWHFPAFKPIKSLEVLQMLF